MDQSLDEVRPIIIPRRRSISKGHFFHFRQIISARPKTRGIRRGAGSRRGSARQQVLGTAATPAGRARAAAVAPVAAVKPAPTTNAVAEKIMVSNLPQDVNEAQIKVGNQ